MDEIAGARAELARVKEKLHRLNSGTPMHNPNDDGLRSSLERQEEELARYIAACDHQNP